MENNHSDSRAFVRICSALIVVSVLVALAGACGPPKDDSSAPPLPTNTSTATSTSTGTGTGTGTGPGTDTGTGTGTGTGSGSGTSTDTGTGTGTGSGTGQTIEYPTPNEGSGHINIYIPSSYTTSTPSPVIFLFNEQISDWEDIADNNDIILVDLDEYNNTSAIINKLNISITHIEATYTVDQDRYHFAGWSAGGNIVIIIAAQNQDFLATTMVFPGTGGSSAQSAMASRTGHKIRLFYACGSEDPNYDWTVVQYEANFWASSYGYTTQFTKVDGSEHYISESTYHIRKAAWDWVKDFTKTN